MPIKKLIQSILFILILPSLSFSSDEMDKILKKIEVRYSSKTYSTDFFQHSTLKALDIKRSAGGYAVFSHPGKMYWEYNFPDHQRQVVVTNAETVWVYKKITNEVTTIPAKDYFQEGMGWSFLSNVKAIRKNYALEQGHSEDKDKFLIIMSPHEKNFIVNIEVMVLKENGKILYVKTTNKNMDYTIFNFTNEKFLENFDEDIFNFKIPANANVSNLSQ